MKVDNIGDTIGCGEMRMVEYLYTDREYFLYHFGMLEEYVDGVKKDLGYQSETSLVLGIDFYHYDENWWIHTWGNWMPVHYGHSKHMYLCLPLPNSLRRR